jgi:cyanophycin synthetase
VLLRDGQIVFARGNDETPLVAASAIPAAGKQTPAELEQVLAAMGAAWALGIGEDLIRAGSETFQRQSDDATKSRAKPAAAKR